MLMSVSSQGGGFGVWRVSVFLWLKFILFKSDFILRLIGLVVFCSFLNDVVWSLEEAVENRVVWVGADFCGIL